jgi:type II secretion system protein G
MKKIKFNKEGFTLIELLVVVAIIGILASVILVSLNGARDRSKDAVIKSELKTIQTAVEWYFLDNDTYVIPGGFSAGGNGWATLENGTTYVTSITNALATAGYLGQNAFGSTEQNYMMYNCNTGQDYTLYATLSNSTVSETAAATGGTCGSAGAGAQGKNYAIGNL